MKPSKVPPILAPRKPALYVFPCGCIAEGTRTNRVQSCDGTACNYSPRKPPGTRTYRG